MSLSPEEKRRFLKALDEDEEFRLAIAARLGISTILDELRRLREDFNRLIEEVRGLREDFNKLRGDQNRLIDEQNQLRQELVRLREDQNKLREDFNRLLEEQKRLREELVKLREDFNKLREDQNRLMEEQNQLRQELVKLREDFNRLVEEQRQLREDQNKLREDFNKLVENQNKLREDQNQLRQELVKLREDFNKFVKIEEERWMEANSKFKWLMNALSEIRDALGGGFEYYTAKVVSLLLRERGIECEVMVNVTLPVDGYKEVDVFCPNPLVVGEVTVALRSIEEAEGQLTKLETAVKAAEKFTGKAIYMKVLAVETAPGEVAQYLDKRAKEQGVYLIIGRRYEGLPGV